MQARVTREHQARISKEIKMTEHVRTYGNVSQKGQKGITYVPTPLGVLRVSSPGHFGVISCGLVKIDQGCAVKG